MAAKVKLAAKTVEPDDDGQAEADIWEDASAGKSERISWLWPARYMFCSVGILEGLKGTGKSSLACAMAAALTAGAKLPGYKSRERGNVLYLAGEDPWASIVRPRLEAAGADIKRIKRLKDDPRGGPGRLYLPGAIDALQAGIVQHKARLVILDPWIYYLDPVVCSRSEQEVRAVVDDLNSVAQATRSLILLLRNLTKNTSADRLFRGLGSTAIGDVARSIFCIDWPDRRCSRRVMRLVAGNALGLTPALEYELASADGVLSMTHCKELANDEDDPDGELEDAGERDARGDARKLLKLLLKGEWVPAKVILAEGLNCGIGVRTLRAVKAELHVQSRRKPRANPPCWEWGPPKGGW